MTVTPYNFKKPDGLHGALEQQFHGWLQTACALAGLRWAKEVPVPLELSPLSCDALHAAPAFLALAEESVTYPVLLHDQLPTVMAWPRRLALALVATLLGDVVTEWPVDRDLTAVDESLFVFFLRDLLLPPFLEAWNGKAALHPGIGERVPHPRWAKVFPPAEGLLVAPFRLKGPFGEAEWSWLVPKKALLTSLGDQGGALQEQAIGQKRLQAQVRELPVKVSVQLGTVELPLSQLARLRAGDVILLDQRIDRPLKVHVEGREKFQGWPARSGERQTVQLG